MYMDRTSALRKEFRVAMKALREEQEAMKTLIQEELLEEIDNLTEKNTKYKVYKTYALVSKQ